MSRYLKLTYAILVGLIIFSLFRIGILIAYYDQFKDNSFWMIFLSLLHGIRFDASIFLTIISPFIVLLLLPVNSKIYERIVYWALYIVYFIMVIYLMIDAVYFGYVNRHLAGELAQLSQDKEYISTMGFEYWWLVSLVFLAGFIGAYFWNKLVRIETKKSEYNKKANIKSALYFLLAGLIVFILIRSSFDIKPISTINAFVSGSNSLGNLTLNGLFTSLRYMTENSNVKTDIYNFYDDNEAHQFILSLKNNKCEQPFHFNKKPNIVFILLESWSAYYIDAFNGKKTDFGAELTPNFNKLAKKGIKYMHHYSPERRSISAIQAILLGIPPMDNIPRLGFGLETIAGSGNLASALYNDGYDTIFIQSSKRNSFYLDVIAKSVGFKEYYGMEDLDDILDYPDKKASQFGWDYETYMKLYDALKNKGKDKPFFAFLFTGTTHVPYAEPNSINVKFPHNTSNENGFKNTLIYADWSLGEFMKKMEQEDFYKDTIFIFTADHVLGRFENTEFPEDYHVPLLIYAPAFEEAKEVYYTTNHVDLPATILDLAGIYNNKSLYVGDSIFCNDNESYSVVHSFGSAKIIQNDKWLIHSFANVLDTNPKNMSDEEKNNLAKILLSYYQESFNIMMGKNK